MYTIAVVLVALMLVNGYALEWLCGRINARRVRKTGLGGTRDIVLLSKVLHIVLLVAFLKLMFAPRDQAREQQKARTASLPSSELRTSQC